MVFDLKTVAGVVSATIVLVQLIKLAFGSHGWFGKVPIWVYAVGVSAILTVLANVVFHTLPGNLWEVMWECVQNAAIASGLYEWWKNVTKPMDQSSTVTGK